MNKIAVLIGTRPGIIKMAPLIHELEKRSLDYMVIHTGQHYSDNMSAQILSDVGLNTIHYTIERPPDAISHARQTAYMLVAIEDVLIQEKIDTLLVCGDANTNFAGALAARKIHVKVGHVEAGLRSFDWRMPEEHNRVMIDHISDYLFAPTQLSKDYLIKEDVKGDVFVVGNTIVDSTLKYSKCIVSSNSDVESKLKEKEYIVLTTHREENVDNPEILKNIFTAIKQISDKYNIQIIFPMHPRTRERANRFNLFNILNDIKLLDIIDPLRYPPMLQLVKNAKIIITDSGGLQEESCILNVPCLTIRENTERPETVNVGANKIVGTSYKRLLAALEGTIAEADFDWPNPYGDGRSAKRIIDVCIYGQPEDEFCHQNF